MFEKPLNPLRQRRIDDMTARRFKEKVQKGYVGKLEPSRSFQFRQGPLQ